MSKQIIEQIEEILDIKNVKTRSMFNYIGLFYEDKIFLYLTRDKNVLIRAQTDTLFSYCKDVLKLEQVVKNYATKEAHLSLFILPKGWETKDVYKEVMHRSFVERKFQVQLRNYKRDDNSWDSCNVHAKKITKDLLNAGIKNIQELKRLGAIPAFLLVLKKKKNLTLSRLHTYQTIIDGSYPFPLSEEKQKLLNRSYESKVKSWGTL
ncbi:TfoX/Sxy family DNA transformation protein [Aliivibrio fischeri]|uniref:TfoX/Sxy family DNA transformation protein n=1 Tax=Aliivibrio fischeri TaxID=668 RepID=UPI0007C58F5F|nr:TfoX/Sxy family DNA transformation protein [Aliivibrio fischeri]